MQHGRRVHEKEQNPVSDLFVLGFSVGWDATRKAGKWGGYTHRGDQ